jgi:hypothetical protein
LRPIGQPSNPLWFGTGIHLAFAEWYVPGLKRGRDLRDTWSEYCDGEIRFIRTQAKRTATDNTEEKIVEYVEAKELGIAMLDGYLEKYGTDESWEVIAPEQVFAVLIPDVDGKTPLIELNGTFDGVYRDLVDGLIKLMEHKTAAQISTSHLSLDDQAGTYWAVATHALRNEGLIKKTDAIDGIQYNFLRKAKADERPVNADGSATNKPTKAHYVEAFKLQELNGIDGKEKLEDLERIAVNLGITVLGEVSKVQPAANFERVYIERTRGEQKKQLEKIRDEALNMNAMRYGELPLYKTPTRDCAHFCEFFAMCELHESGNSDWEQYRDAMFRVQDPYSDHRKSA